MNSGENGSNTAVGIVVIGRNEGARLMRCLRSVCSSGYCVVYVDSGSRDDSVRTACSLGCAIIELDPNRPFSAARARNQGFWEVMQHQPGLRFVQFLDGDCVLASGWLDAAQRALLETPEFGAVVGHLQERSPEATQYNRLCALEWKCSPGDLQEFGGFGGISMMRVDAFREVGGFCPDVIAGEDSELGVRLSLAGYRVTRIDCCMATHDANITKFSQWWQRAVRAGHAIGQRAQLNGRSVARDCVRERNSTWFWGVIVPLLILVLILPTQGASLALLAGYVYLGGRVFKTRRRNGDSVADAWLYTRFLLLAKLANGIGLIRFYLNKLRKRYLLIEYK